MRSAYKDLVRTSERGGQLGRPVCRCKDTIKTDFKEIIWDFGSGYRAMLVLCECNNEPCLPYKS
jgi:hypothetical protein